LCGRGGSGDRFTDVRFGAVAMRTMIEIDETLLRRAMQLGGFGTREAAVEAALRLFVQTRQQGGIRELRGRVRWEGNLEKSRCGRNCK